MTAGPRRHFYAAMAVFVFFFLIVSCDSGTKEPAVVSGDVRVGLDTYPSPPVALKTTNFLVRLVGADGAPVAGAEVVLDLSMPGMYHGENRPPCRHTGEGEYLCQGYLVMGGLWEVAVEVNGSRMKTIRLDVLDQ